MSNTKTESPKTNSPSKPQSSQYTDAFKSNFTYAKEFTLKRMNGIEIFISLLNQRIDCERAYCVAMRRIGNTNCDIYEGYFYTYSKI